LNATAIMLAVVVPVIVLTLVFAWWFRSGNRRARYLSEWSYSGGIELVTWSIPALIIMFLGGIAWIGAHDLDPPRPIRSAVAAIYIEVTIVYLGAH
jgi:cytochrome o ubiquinol oxidase subunit II